MDEKNKEMQLLHTELTIAQEKLFNTANELITTKVQYELRLNHITDEKYVVVEKSNNLETEIIQLQKKLSSQAADHQTTLKEERTRQEQSEKRWLNLIDQARTETKNLRKNYDIIINNQSKKYEAMQNNLVSYQQKIIAQQTTLDHQKITIADLKIQLDKVHQGYAVANSTIVKLENRQKVKNRR